MATSQNSSNSHLISSHLTHYFSFSSFSSRMVGITNSYASAQRTSSHHESKYQHCHRCGVSGHSPFHCIFFTQKIRCEYCHIGHHSSVCFRRTHRGRDTGSLSTRGSFKFYQGNQHSHRSSNSIHGGTRSSANQSNPNHELSQSLQSGVPQHHRTRISQRKSTILRPFLPLPALKKSILL